MKFTKSIPTKDGLYVVRRPDSEPTVFRVWTNDSGVTMVSWLGRARSKTMGEIVEQHLFPLAEWSENPIDISEDEIESIDRIDVDEQTIVDEDNLDNDPEGFGDPE